MIRRCIKTAAALFLLSLLAAGAMAQGTMRVYMGRDTLDDQTAWQLVEMIGRAVPQAQWEAVLEEETGESLRTLVLSDRAPALAVCAPGEALERMAVQGLWALALVALGAALWRKNQKRMVLQGG